MEDDITPLKDISNTGQSRSPKKKKNTDKSKKKKKNNTPEFDENLGYLADRDGNEDEPQMGGSILYVRLTNFMSHKSFEFPNPKSKDPSERMLKSISFICGKNGSGKSAILESIKLLFGGKGRQKSMLSYGKK